MTKNLYPSDLQDAWAKVIAYAWKNKEFLRQLRNDPKQTINNVVNSGNPEKLIGACATIIEHINSPDSEEGFLPLPNLPEELDTLSDDQLYGYANQGGLFGLMRFT